jgi:hypothetical protein
MKYLCIFWPNEMTHKLTIALLCLYYFISMSIVKASYLQDCPNLCPSLLLDSSLPLRLLEPRKNDFSM